MSFVGWIVVGIGVGAAVSIVFEEPALIGFGAAFGIMAGIFWGRGGPAKDEEDAS